jgi:hypothetical protein
MISAEHDHNVGIELPHPLGRSRQRRAEPVPERMLDIAFLAGAVACADNQPL